jgi:hypothetical protein
MAISQAARRKLGATQMKRRLATQLRVEANRLLTLAERCGEFGYARQSRMLQVMATQSAAISLAINTVADEERDPRGAR